MPDNNLSSIGPSYQPYVPNVGSPPPEPSPSSVSGGACGGTEGGMSVDPDQFYEDGTGLTNSSYELNAGIPDYLLAEEPPAAEEGPATEDAPADDVPYTTFRGNAQQGHLSARRAANDGTGGASGTSPYENPAAMEEPVEDKPGGGKVVFLDFGLDVGLFTVGAQKAFVIDEECGIGFVESIDGGAAVGVGTPVSASAMLGAATYDGSFDTYNDATEVDVNVGAGVEASGRVYLDEKGEPIGSGAALGVGVGAGAGVSVTKSLSNAWFPACPEK